MSAINHHRGGSGEPLVLIHGIGHHWQAWAPVLPALEERFEVFACDSPGFGGSAPLPAGVAPRIPAYVDAFEAFFAEQGLERPHVAGNSMGGAIALELARRGAVRSATALSPAGFWTSAGIRYCQLSLGLVGGMPRPARPLVRAAVGTALGRRLLLAQLVGRPAGLDAAAARSSVDTLWAAPAFAEALAAFESYRFTAPSAPLPCPVTVAWGQSDWLLPMRTQGARARRLLPQAEHRILDAGHLPYSDDPVAVVEAIRATAARAAVPVAR